LQNIEIIFCLSSVASIKKEKKKSTKYLGRIKRRGDKEYVNSLAKGEQNSVAKKKKKKVYKENSPNKRTCKKYIRFLRLSRECGYFHRKTGLKTLIYLHNIPMTFYN